MKFNGIYLNIMRQPPSGATEMDIIGLAFQQYEEQELTPFKAKVFWDVVREKAKWKGLKSSDDVTCGRGKRVKTSKSSYTYSASSDGRTGIDLNIDEPIESPRVHVGRDAARAAKRKGKSGGTSSSGVSYTSEHLEKLNVTLDKIGDARQMKEKKAIYKMLQEDPDMDPEEKKRALAKARQDLYKACSWI